MGVDQAVFLEKTDDGFYLIYFMSADNFEKAQKVTKESTNPVDQYHKNFKDNHWESGERLETLLELYNVNHPSAE